MKSGRAEQALLEWGSEGWLERHADVVRRETLGRSICGIFEDTSSLDPDCKAGVGRC